MPAGQRTLKWLHLVATTQFASSAALVLYWSLRETGMHPLAVFSLSAQGAVLLAFCALIYGFAVFRGGVGERAETEHPFTGSSVYRVFYLAMPILGGVTAGLDQARAGMGEGLKGLALGTVLTAFALWLFVDPLAGLAETMLPEARRKRSERKGAQKLRREERETAKRRRLEAFVAARRERLRRMEPLVAESARKLAGLLENVDGEPRAGAEEAALIGFEAWRAGGLDCMREVYASTRKLCSENSVRFDYLDWWWDGIGQWRRVTAVRRAAGAG